MSDETRPALLSLFPGVERSYRTGEPTPRIGKERDGIGDLAGATFAKPALRHAIACRRRAYHRVLGAGGHLKGVCIGLTAPLAAV